MGICDQKKVKKIKKGLDFLAGKGMNIRNKRENPNFVYEGLHPLRFLQGITAFVVDLYARSPGVGFTEPGADYQSQPQQFERTNRR